MTIAVGAAGVGLSLASISLANGLLALLASVAVMAAARCLIEPVMNTTIAEIASRAGGGMLASYFGFGALSVAIGGSLGQLLGGWSFDLAQASDKPALPWITLGIVGTIVTIALTVFARSTAARGMIA